MASRSRSARVRPVVGVVIIACLLHQGRVGARRRAFTLDWVGKRTTKLRQEPSPAPGWRMSALHPRVAGIMLVAMSGDERGGGPVRRPKMIERPQLPPRPLANLKALIYELYVEAGTPPLDQIAKWMANDRDLDAIVGRDTVHRIIGGSGMPPSQAHLAALVTVLARAARWDPGDAVARARDLWVTARMASGRYPEDGIRVSQADPRRLGMHAAISVPEMPDQVPPEYVPRDTDGGESGCGPGCRPPPSGAGLCCWSAGPRSARPAAHSRRSARCCRTGGWCTRPARPKSPRSRPLRPRRRTAALDAARLGARAPLSIDFLRAAAPGYCTSQQQADAPEDWFEQALAYATGKLHGGAAALSSAGAGMGQVVGYTVADYLIQHASRERRYARLPASTWDAITSHIRDPADTARLADSARNRLLYRCAIPLYRHAADVGDEDAAPARRPAGPRWRPRRVARPGRGR